MRCRHRTEEIEFFPYSQHLYIEVKIFRAGHPILFLVFDIRYSDTLLPVFDIDISILFLNLWSDTRYSISILSSTSRLEAGLSTSVVDTKQFLLTRIRLFTKSF
jgi:hypothetical protein